jgi:hypothetical protein
MPMITENRPDISPTGVALTFSLKRCKSSFGQSRCHISSLSSHLNFGFWTELFWITGNDQFVGAGG